MKEINNIERFYDYFDAIALYLYNINKHPYLESMNLAFQYLLEDTIDFQLDDEGMNFLEEEKNKIIDIDFTSEEIRKSVQLGLLKGYKHMNVSNAFLTPDTIGIFIGYLIKKVYNESIKFVLDPMVGSGNLVYTVLNDIEENAKVIGVDHDPLKCELARNLGDLMDYENQIFMQDSLSFYANEIDLILCDLPIQEEKNPYLPYQIISHHLDSLAKDKFMFVLIENDFFEQEQMDIFKKELDEKAHMYGLIKLSESLFKNTEKSILILQKKKTKQDKIEDFLLIDLPSFEDREGMALTVQQIETWFNTRKEEKK
jgi:site-specific DNA-methyltransferase (adenine-specific)